MTDIDLNEDEMWYKFADEYSARRHQHRSYVPPDEHSDVVEECSGTRDVTVTVANGTRAFTESDMPNDYPLKFYHAQCERIPKSEVPTQDHD